MNLRILIVFIYNNSLLFLHFRGSEAERETDCDANHDVTMETMKSEECKEIRTIAIIAEGIPENMTRRLLRVAKEKEVTVIGT